MYFAFIDTNNKFTIFKISQAIKYEINVKTYKKKMGINLNK